MRQVASAFALMWASLSCAVCVPSAADELPWAFKGKAADGYSIDLVTVEPAPGSPLTAGSTVAFRITVSYTLSIAKSGAVILVFQDEKNRPVTAGGSQVSQAVSEPAGTVSLTESMTIPNDAKELRLFVPLVPNGPKNTSGEVTIRYPIKRK